MIKHVFLLLMFLVGFAANATENNIDEPVLQFMPPKATTLVKIGVNLDVEANNKNAMHFYSEDKDSYSFLLTDTVYDSFGLSHTLQLFFIRTDSLDWSVIVMIDGADVGDKDKGFIGKALFYLKFAPTGMLARDSKREIILKRWTPRDRQGNPNGAVSTLPLKIDVSACTLFAGEDYVKRYVLQNGYPKGELEGYKIDKNQCLYLFYSNGRKQLVGQFMKKPHPPIQKKTQSEEIGFEKTTNGS